MDRKLIDYLPEQVSEIHEFKVIMNAEQSEIERLWDKVDEGLSNQFLATATEYGIERWERMLKLSKKDTDSIEDRRLRILAKVNEQLPFTKITLEDSLKALCGENGYKLVISYGEYRVNVQVALTAKTMLDEVDKLLRRVLPANLLVTVVLLYNQWAKLETKTWEELESLTWDEILEAEL